jgi:hypothetical protein
VKDLPSDRAMNWRKLLAHADQRVRLGAQWALAGKSDGAEKLAVAAKTGTGPFFRLHAIWGLGNIARLESYKDQAAGIKRIEPLLALLGDPDAEVRAQAAATAGPVLKLQRRPVLAWETRNREPQQTINRRPAGCPR